MPPAFLGLDEIIEIHRDQIERYGGRPGIRDMGLLQSAVAMPQASFGGKYLHTDLFEMAAAYLFHIVRNHPFVDGNKRAGTAAAMVFLALNGKAVRVTNTALVRTVLSVARGAPSLPQSGPAGGHGGGFGDRGEGRQLRFFGTGA